MTAIPLSDSVRNHTPGTPRPRVPSTSKRLAGHLCGRKENRKSARPAAWRGGDDRERTLLSLLPVVKHVALQVRRHLPVYTELEDLMGDGVIGLHDAAAKFDSSRRVRIEDYARHRIRGAILDALRKEDHASRDFRRKIKNVESVSHALECRLGRQATSSEMASALGMDLDEWYKAAADVQRAKAPAAPLPGSAEGGLADAKNIISGQEDPFAACYRHEQAEILARALNCLEERERTIIALYHQEALTMSQIGKRLEVDESRVSQLHTRALERLRECVQAVVNRPRACAMAPGLGETSPQVLG